MPGIIKKRSSQLQGHLLDITPGPVLPGLERLDNRVVGGVKMPGGVLILRIVTATDMSTGETEAQMHPGITRFQAILAPIGARRDLTYLVEVATVLCHACLLSLFIEYNLPIILWQHLLPGPPFNGRQHRLKKANPAMAIAY